MSSFDWKCSPCSDFEQWMQAASLSAFESATVAHQKIMSLVIVNPGPRPRRCCNGGLTSPAPPVISQTCITIANAASAANVNFSLRHFGPAIAFNLHTLCVTQKTLSLSFHHLMPTVDFYLQHYLGSFATLFHLALTWRELRVPIFTFLANKTYFALLCVMDDSNRGGFMCWILWGFCITVEFHCFQIFALMLIE